MEQSNEKSLNKLLLEFQSELQQEFKSDHINLSKLLLGLATGSLTLFVSQSKNLPASELLFYIYLFLLLSILSGFFVQFLHLGYTRHKVKEVRQTGQTMAHHPEKHQEIYQKLRITFSNKRFVFWIETCSWLQAIFFAVGFLLVAALLLITAQNTC